MKRPPNYRIGTILIDSRDGRECMVSDVTRRGMTIRKKCLAGSGWQTLRYEAGRFTRRGRRRYRVDSARLAAERERERLEAVEQYGEELVRLAEANNLTYRQAAEALR